MTTRALFLDFDGVLLTPSYQLANGSGKLDPSKVCLVDLLCFRFDLQIVVSSSWRGDLGFLHKILFNAGMSRQRLRTLDQTPTLDTGRGQEILAWLREHPHIKAFAILDDDSFDMGPLSRWLVQTDTEVGLTEEHLPMIEERLKVPLPWRKKEVAV